MDDCNRAMVLLNDDFSALLDLGKHGMDVASEFGFGNADSHHRFDNSAYLSLLPSRIAASLMIWNFRSTAAITVGLPAERFEIHSSREILDHFDRVQNVRKGCRQRRRAWPLPRLTGPD
jgi:hypothetical protein